MKIIIRAFTFLLVFAFPAKSQNLVISDVTIITPKKVNELVTQHNQWIEVVDGRIARISSTPLKQNDGSQLIDGKGKYLIPGLMDSHVHTQTMPGLDLGDPESLTLQRAFLTQQPRSYLYYGVTQILDPSLTPDVVANFKRAPVNPDILFCGSAPIVGGYALRDASIESAAKRKPYFIHRPTQDGVVPKHFKPEEHTPEAVVRRIKNDGAICIKVYIEDGFNLSSDWPFISMDLLKRVRKAADDHGLLVVAHANALDMQEIALKANVDVLAHGMWNWLNESSRNKLPKAIQYVADDIVKSKTAYQPTLNVMRSLRDVNVPDHMTTKGYTDVVPKCILDWYKSERGQWFAREMRQGWGTTDLARITDRQTQILEQGERVLSYLYQQGHPMLLATDTPPAPTYASQPGLSAYMELQAMHKAGVALPDLLKSATINNALAFGIEQDYGSIESGKSANLLLLTKDPLQSVEAYDSIERVIIQGVSIEREQLRAPAQAPE
jgi:imidazolonepropionase-like amidohydrolase